MHKLNKKGFIIMELLCSITLFMLMSGISLNILNKSFKLKVYNYNLENSINFLEAFIKHIKYNMTYEEINTLNHNSPIVISYKSMNIDNLKYNNLLYDNVNFQSKDKYPCLYLSINKSMDMHKFYIKFYVHEDKFFKGEFLKCYE